MRALSGRVGFALGRRDPGDDRLQHRFDVRPQLRRNVDDLGLVHAQQIYELLGHHLGARVRQVDLVDHGHDLEIVLERQEEVGERLGLDALRRVDDQQHALGGRHAARHLVGEVDVARGVDEVQLVLAPVGRPVGHRDGVHLDRDPALALEVHGVQDLLPHLAAGERAGALQQPVGERRLAVVDVRDDREVADTVGLHAEGNLPAGWSRRMEGGVPADYTPWRPTSNVPAYPEPAGSRASTSSLPPRRKIPSWSFRRFRGPCSRYGSPACTRSESASSKKS